MRSDKLMQFHDLLETPAREKEILRDQLNRDVQEFLARGGQPVQLAHGETGYKGSVRPKYNKGPE